MDHHSNLSFRNGSSSSSSSSSSASVPGLIHGFSTLGVTAEGEGSDHRFRELWNELSPMLSRVMNQSEEISQKEFIDQYRLVFNLVKLEMKSRQLLQSLQEFLKNYLVNSVSPALTTTLSPTSFMLVYAREWAKYRSSSKWLTLVFKPIDQVDNGHDQALKTSEPRPQRVPVKMWECWKSEIYDSFRERLQSVISGAILADRQGDPCDSDSLQTVIGSYADLGQDAPPYDALGNDFYISEFLDRFLSETAEYYTAEAQKFMSDNSSIAYLQWASEKLNYEKYRSLHYHFDHISNQKHAATLNQAIISNYRDKLLSLLPGLFVEHQKDDLHRLYWLLNRINDLFPLIDNFFNYLVSTAKNIYTLLLSEAEALAQAPANRIPFSVKYIESFIAFYNTFVEIVQHSFEGNSKLEAAFLRACREALNNNAINTAGSTFHETASFAALYSHSLLSDKALDADAIQAKSRSIVVIYNFLEAKDAFHLYYQRYYRTRLLSLPSLSRTPDSGYSHEHEAAVQAALSKVAPWDFVNSLERMHQDIDYSCSSLRPKFEQYLLDHPPLPSDCQYCSLHAANLPSAASSTSVYLLPSTFCSLSNLSHRLPVQFAGSVLTQVAWPIDADEMNVAFRLPPELHYLAHQFLTFYESVHRSRTLEWIHERSRAEIATEWLPKTYLITTNHFQLTVLLAFNRIPKQLDGIASFLDLKEWLGMDPRYLSTTLASLCRIGLLQKQPISAQPPFTDQVRFRLGRHFTQQRTELDLALLWKKPQIETDEDPAELAVLNKQRDMCTQAAIVRIMKSRKELSHQKLVEAVSDQTQNWFPTIVSRIKSQIDFLINHNPPFLERVDAKTYRYIT